MMYMMQIFKMSKNKPDLFVAKNHIMDFER